MKIKNKFHLILFFACIWILIGSTNSIAAPYSDTIPILTEEDIYFGADDFVNTDSIWQGKSIVLVVNHSSVLSTGEHLVDALYSKGCNIEFIYAPEHGFRGEADAGELVSSGKDAKTGIPIQSLYGSNKKPSIEDLQAIDLIVFDIQDVGVRFYTYLSTMFYIMEAAAQAQIELNILDRPNPNGYFVDGPVLDTNFRSFVGILPIPIVHGMTLGELALMIKGEKFVKLASQLNLKVFPCKGYTHQSTYELPIPPSPNLPNLRSILLYPSLCYFEACLVSVGRGTHKQFQQIGSPHLKGEFSYSFIPEPMKGAKQPKFEGDTCYGIDLTDLSHASIVDQASIQWEYLFNWYSYFTDLNMVDRERFMNLLMGTNSWVNYLQESDEEGWVDSYQEKLDEFKKIRKRYLLYPE